jgi:hypothetical protein
MLKLSRPATVSHLAMGTVCNSYKIRGRKLKTEGWAGVTFDRNQNTMTSHPPEDDWSAEDLANQRRVAEDVERALERHYSLMVIWVCVAGIAIAAAIHFLSTP